MSSVPTTNFSSIDRLVESVHPPMSAEPCPTLAGSIPSPHFALPATMRSETEASFSDEPFKIPVADRVKRLPPYLFGKINKLKHKKRQDGVDVIDLGMGNPTDPPEQFIIDKMIEALSDARNHRYSVSNGVENLRREVAKRYDRKYGVSLNPQSEVIACIGSKEGFSHMCLALMGPGDTAIVPAPTFPIHSYSVMLASGNVIALDVRNPQEFLSNIAYTCEHLFPKPKLVIVNFPHNPSGTCIEQNFYVDLVALAKKYGFLVISDFAYADICYDGYQAPSFLATPGAIDVGVELTTMSKGYSMAGWRIGFCSGNSEMVRCLVRSRATTTTASSRRSKSPRSLRCGTATRRLNDSVWNTNTAATRWSTASTAKAGISMLLKPACLFGRKFPNRGPKWVQFRSR